MAFLGLPIIGQCIGLAKVESSYLRLINMTNSYDVILSNTGKITIDMKELDCALLTVEFTKIAVNQDRDWVTAFVCWIQRKNQKETFLCGRQDPN